MASTETHDPLPPKTSSLEDVERQLEQTKETVKQLEHRFTEKVLDVVPEREGPMEDPLGIYNNPAAGDRSAKSKDPANTAAEDAKNQRDGHVVQGHHRRKGRRKVQENIFRDFGKEHDKSALHEIEIGGIVVSRANFKRFWQCDRELSRWKQDLDDHSRNDKLLQEELSRCQQEPDHSRDRRLKKSGQKPDSPERAEFNGVRRASSCAQQLKELQNKLKPRGEQHRRKVKRFEFDIGGMGFFHGNAESSEGPSRAISMQKSEDGKGELQRKRAPVNETEDAVYTFLNFLMRQTSTLEEAFNLIDRNGNGILSSAEFVTSLRDMGFTDDLRFFFRMLEKDNDGFINIGEFMNLKPYLLKGLETHRVKVRSVGVAESSRLSDNTAQQADLDVSGELFIEVQDSHREHRKMDVLKIPRSEASAAGSVLNSPGGSGVVRRRPSGQTDMSETEALGDGVSDALEVSPRSGGAGKRLAPQPRGPALDSSQRSSASAPCLPHLRAPRGPQMPRTLSLLLFRNADKLHAGEVVFVNRWPLPTLRDLYTACGKACRPVVGPVEALLCPDLLPLRSCEEVRNGGIYLLKGHEGLDPPPLFFSHQETSHLTSTCSAPSLRNMHMAKEAVAADQEIRSAPSPLQLQMTAQSRLGSTWLISQVNSMPSVGAPPWASQGLPQNPRALGKWQAKPKLAMSMLWSGLGQLPRHTDYQNWQPALGSRSAASRVSIDQSLALPY